jgi:hypothetical protein
LPAEEGGPGLPVALRCGIDVAFLRISHTVDGATVTPRAAAVGAEIVIRAP